MNKKELSKYYHLTNEIKDLQEKIKELDLTLISSPLLTGMPHSNKVSNPTEQRNILILALKRKLEIREAKAMEELIKIEDYISSIEDIELRQIFDKRYVQLKSWEVIANEIHMSERNVFRKVSKYLKENKDDRKGNQIHKTT
jgi:hypothetical protein